MTLDAYKSKKPIINIQKIFQLHIINQNDILPINTIYHSVNKQIILKNITDLLPFLIVIALADSL